MTQQIITLHAESQRESCRRIIDNLPLDGSMQVVIRPYVKPGSQAQRGAYWAVRLAEIADQAWLDGRQYPAPVWHEYLKQRFLPDYHDDEITLPGYVKWMEMPGGELKMVGSTEKLTAKGRSEYIGWVEAFCALELGVRFSELKSAP